MVETSNLRSSAATYSMLAAWFKSFRTLFFSVALIVAVSSIVFYFSWQAWAHIILDADLYSKLMERDVAAYYDDIEARIRASSVSSFFPLGRSRLGISAIAPHFCNADLRAKASHSSVFFEGWYYKFVSPHGMSFAVIPGVVLGHDVRVMNATVHGGSDNGNDSGSSDDGNDRAGHGFVMTLGLHEVPTYHYFPLSLVSVETSSSQDEDTCGTGNLDDFCLDPSEIFELRMGKNVFRPHSVELDLPGDVSGRLSITNPERYVRLAGERSPLALWGPLRLFQVETNIMGLLFGLLERIGVVQCNHAVLWMSGDVDGTVKVHSRQKRNQRQWKNKTESKMTDEIVAAKSTKIEGSVLDFSKGRAYVEKDWGREFPEQYIWIACNMFSSSLSPPASSSLSSPSSSLLVSVASIPLGDPPKISFVGFLSYFRYNNTTFTFASYTGASVKTHVEGCPCALGSDQTESKSIKRVRACVCDDSQTHDRVKVEIQDAQYQLIVDAEGDRNHTNLLWAPRYRRHVSSRMDTKRQMRLEMVQGVPEHLNARVHVTLRRRSDGFVLFKGEGTHAGLEVMVSET